MNEIMDSVAGVICRFIRYPPENVTAATGLVDDLDMDNMTRLSVILNLEWLFDIEIPETQFDAATTVGDLVAVVTSITGHGRGHMLSVAAE
jgi:acyl carrier protein